MVAANTRQPVREITHRTSGITRGPITRLVSPGDLGDIIKPFVFLDHAVFDGRFEQMSIEQFWHPHSGIATVTVPLDGAIRVLDTTGADVVLPAGGIEWMRAGNGVWHTGQAEPGTARAFQLWVALPPELENGPNATLYVQPQRVRSVGPARVILGSYRGVASPIDAPPMTYLQVGLDDGERWTFAPSPGQTVGWLAISDGELRTPERVRAGEIAVFERSDAPIELVANGPTRFVIGAAAPHPHELVLGYYSVHTSTDALRKGEAEIRRIGRRLRDDGTLRFANPGVAL